jgi:transcriptional regulator with XRE-family HTH domain
MTARGLSQAELAQQIGVDTKTLRAIERGEPVKEITMKTVAFKLGVPVEHLLHDVTTDEPRRTLAPAEIEQRDQVVLKRTTAVALKKLLSESREIVWSLDLPEIEAQGKEALLKFEELIKTWHFQLRTASPSDSLRAQIERLETTNEITHRIQKLSDSNIFVLSGRYSRWERGERRDPYEDQVCHVDYASSAIAVIALRTTSVTSVHVTVERGDVPPGTFRDLPYSVSIDGHEVWDGLPTRRVRSFARELDDEVPF